MMRLYDLFYTQEATVQRVCLTTMKITILAVQKTILTLIVNVKISITTSATVVQSAK